MAVGAAFWRSEMERFIRVRCLLAIWSPKGLLRFFSDTSCIHSPKAGIAFLQPPVEGKLLPPNGRPPLGGSIPSCLLLRPLVPNRWVASLCLVLSEAYSPRLTQLSSNSAQTYLCRLLLLCCSLVDRTTQHNFLCGRLDSTCL